MASIVINEISQNYTYNIGASSYAQVALPITACWGPGYYDPNAYGTTKDVMLEETVWQKFPATQAGLEAFVSTYRGPASNYRTFKDYSYQMAMTLLTSGYDVLVCRLCPGTPAQATFNMGDNASFTVKAKYPGTFGNSLKVTLSKVKSPLMGHDYWNIITYVVDSSGVKTAVENKVFVFDIDNSSDSILHIDELESNFLTFEASDGSINEDTIFSYEGVSVSLTGGYDIAPMVTSAEYDAAVARLKECSALLVEYSEDVDVAQSAVSSDEAHVNKLDTDLVAYTNQLEIAQREEPVDEAKVADLQAKIAAVTADKQTWTNKLAEDRKALTDAQSRYTSTSEEIATQQGIVDSQSTEFRNVMIAKALADAKIRYGVKDSDEDTAYPEYVAAISNINSDNVDNAFCLKLMNQEWIYTNACDIYDLLKDKLAYNPNRIISPGWDDQNIEEITGLPVRRLNTVSPFHSKLMTVAYYSRCATAMLDIPKCLPRSAVYNESTRDDEVGYAQMLGRFVPDNGAMDVNGSLFQTHSALFAPWGQYVYVGTSKQSPAPPAFQALLIQRAMILNQSNQYEWALPTNRKHNLSFGKLDYTVPKKLLDEWQTLEGVGVNVIANIPDMGLTLWGNSTLYEVPPATYQALANLSTRYLVNAVENVVYKCGMSITFKYNNEDAYSAFYAGVTPTLDLMKNTGAIDDYYVRMSADIDGLDQVNANSVIGKVYLKINGVINNITVDLIALPPTADLNQFKA